MQTDNYSAAIRLLQEGKVGVMPTDTIYGIVGSALNPKSVEKIYTLRKRDTSKPMIILISSLDDLKKFGILLTKAQTEFLQKVWPNPVSVILSCNKEDLFYLHRGKNSLAFRLPNNETLLNILKRVGPLVAPSANLAKKEPAETVGKAQEYFGDKVVFYINGGKIKSRPSTVIQLYEDGTRIILRKGAFKV